MPAAQVLGLRAVTEAAEVDDPLDPLRACHPGERGGGGALAGGEVLGSASTHRVDQVIRHVHPVACAAQRFRAQHVSLVQVEAVALELAGAGPGAVAYQASHLPCRACEPGGEASADEPGRAGHEHACAHAAVAPDDCVASEAASRSAFCSSKPPTSLASIRPERSTISTAIVSVPASPRYSTTFRTSV